jgi:hypothetical protein
MKSEFDKEIDSLLREGARRVRAVPFERASVREEGGARATPSGAHLDADEQNAYAENYLPASARTHYAAHLADCDDCRRSVTQLALAAGMPAQLEQRAVATGQEVSPDAASSNAALSSVTSSSVTWRERLGALFAPRAWRYAVPALALLLVGAVVLMFSMREQPRDVSVAQQQQPGNRAEQARPATASPELNHAPQNGNIAAPAVSGEGVAQPGSSSSAPVASEELAAGGRDEQGQPRESVVLNDAEPPPPPQPLSSSVGSAGAPAAAAAVSAPTPAPTPPPAVESVTIAPELETKAKVTQRNDATAREAQKAGSYEIRQQRDSVSGPRRNEQTRNVQRNADADAARDGADRSDEKFATPTPVPTAPARRARQREADREQEGRASGSGANTEGMPLPKPAAETRTVAGRKFRRTGSAWIDTAYNSGQAVTVVRRNSEQYRALVADEPELRRIANALGGEVTVVWKGRAYRIR